MVRKKREHCRVAPGFSHGIRPLLAWKYAQLTEHVEVDPGAVADRLSVEEEHLALIPALVRLPHARQVERRLARQRDALLVVVGRMRWVPVVPAGAATPGMNGLVVPLRSNLHTLSRPQNACQSCDSAG